MAVDFSPTGLRVLREVAQTGSFSAAAASLGYTQSAVSRQVAALEAAAGRRLFDRGRHGVTLTPAGARLLTSAVRVLDELDSARRELSGERSRRPAGATRCVPHRDRRARPEALAGLPPQLSVNLREGTTPALTRALRAGTLDLAIARPHAAVPARSDAESPALRADHALRARAADRRPGEPPARPRPRGRGR